MEDSRQRIADEIDFEALAEREEEEKGSRLTCAISNVFSMINPDLLFIFLSWF